MQPTAEYVEWLRTRRDELARAFGLDTADWSDDALRTRRAEAEAEWLEVENGIPADHSDPYGAARLAELYRRQARIRRDVERLDDLAAVADDHRIAAARFADAADRDESRRHLADEVRLVGGETLTDHVALVFGADDPELLVIAARPAEADSAAAGDSWERPHLTEALRELATYYPQYRDVLWSGRHIRYQEGLRGQTGWADLRPLDPADAAEMQRNIRRRYVETARDRLLTEYLRRRAMGEYPMAWFGPLQSILAGLFNEDGVAVLKTASTALSDDPELPANHPARLVYDVMTGPVPQPRRYRPTGTTRLDTVDVPSFGQVSVLVEQLNTGRWRLVPGGGPLAERFGEMSASDDWRLIEYLQAALNATGAPSSRVADVRDDRPPLMLPELGDVRPELAAAHRAAEQWPAPSDPPASDGDERRARLTDAADTLDEAASRQVIDAVVRARSGGIRLAPGAVYYRAEGELVLAARVGSHARELDRLIAARPDVLNPQSPPWARQLAATVNVNGRVAVSELREAQRALPQLGLLPGDVSVIAAARERDPAGFAGRVCELSAAGQDIAGASARLRSGRRGGGGRRGRRAHGCTRKREGRCGNWPTTSPASPCRPRRRSCWALCCAPTTPPSSDGLAGLPAQQRDAITLFLSGATRAEIAAKTCRSVPIG